MLVTSALMLSRGGLAGSQHQEGADLALRAAESGLRYAQTRLAANPVWRGDGNAVVLSDPDLTVLEERGNVIGILRAPSGEYSQFRIRFNFQDDGAGNRDRYPDPSARSWIDSRYVSVNNIAGGSARPVPRAEGPNFSVLPNSQAPYRVPPGAACLLVEGRAGTGLRELSPDSPNPAPVSGGAVTTRVVEAYLQAQASPDSDAAAMAAGRLSVLLPPDGNRLRVDSNSGVPRLRSKRAIAVEGGNGDANYVSPNGEAVSRDGLTARSSVEQQREGEQDEFYKLAWEDVKKAGDGDQELSAGTYVVWDDGSLHYYGMNYADYARWVTASPANANNPGTVMTLGEGAIVHRGRKLRITDNVVIKPVGDVNEFNFIPRAGAQEDPPGAAPDPEDESEEGEVDLDAIESAVAALPPPAVESGGASSWVLPNISVPSDYSEGLSIAGYSLQLAANPSGSGAVLTYEPGTSSHPTLLDAIRDVPLGLLTSSSPQSSSLRDIARYLTGGSGGGASMEELDLGGAVSAELTPDDLEITFEPPAGESAILSARGNIKIGSKVTGEGGSITSANSIRIVGAGTDLSANIEDGLNLYARGDITLSSLRSRGSNSYEYKDFKMKGVIYAWGDFRAKIGTDSQNVRQWGKFSLEGALVAYGGNPENDPGRNGRGRIRILAKSADLMFNPAYLTALERVPSPSPVQQTFHTVH